MFIETYNKSVTFALKNTRAGTAGLHWRYSARSIYPHYLSLHISPKRRSTFESRKQVSFLNIYTDIKTLTSNNIQWI